MLLMENRLKNRVLSEYTHTYRF